MRHRRSRTAARPLLTAAGLLVLVAAGVAAAPPPATDDRAAGEALEAAGPARESVAESLGEATHPIPGGLRLALGGGTLFPVGSWADGFDPGVSLGAGVERPVRPDVEVGAWVSRAEIRMEGRARVAWTAFEARAAWYPPVNIEPLSLYLTGRAGLLRSVLEAGSGREDEWNLLAGGGAGIAMPLSGRYAVRVEGLWRQVFAEGRGVSLEGGLLIEL